MNTPHSVELIAKIERDSARARAVGWVIVIIVLAALTALLIQTDQINNQLRQQVTANHAQALAAQKDTDATLQAIVAQGSRQSAELKCVAELFVSPKARAGLLSITDFDSCTTAETKTAAPPPAAAPAPAPAAPSKTNAPAPTSSQSNTTNGSGNGNPQPQPTPFDALTNGLHQIGKALGLTS